MPLPCLPILPDQPASYATPKKKIEGQHQVPGKEVMGETGNIAGTARQQMTACHPPGQLHGPEQKGTGDIVQAGATAHPHAMINMQAAKAHLSTMTTTSYRTRSTMTSPRFMV